ncbi:MAG TPA: hypothetical protein VL092_01555 [Chitinophagaceae bacterium]|nr:hypothetical protein [Chitinophagaceae bacterium]
MLYKKHLRNLDELHAERLAIKKKARKKAAALKKAESDKGSLLEQGVGFLSGSLTGSAKLAPVLELASKYALPFVMKRGAQLGVRKIAGTAIKELAFGYLKWKALSIAATIIANKIKKKSQKEA